MQNKRMEKISKEVSRTEMEKAVARIAEKVCYRYLRILYISAVVMEEAEDRDAIGREG